MNRQRLYPVIWSIIILVVAQAATLAIALQQKTFVEENQIVAPEVSLGFPVAYFFGTIIIMGLILFLIPVYVLKRVLKALFTLVYCWGIFIVLGLTLTLIPAVLISVAAGVVWFFVPLVWFHDLLLVLALVSAGSVFGFILSPWTVMILMLLIAVYDFVAVRFGYMLWMAKKMAESETLPAFILPKKLSDWNLNLKKSGFDELTKDKPEREFSVLGGGDIGFPLMLLVSVFFGYGYIGSLIVAVFSLLGLVCAYLIQWFWLKGKPTPALPPIAGFSLIGLLIVTRIA